MKKTNKFLTTLSIVMAIGLSAQSALSATECAVSKVLQNDEAGLDLKDVGSLEIKNGTFSVVTIDKNSTLKTLPNIPATSDVPSDVAAEIRKIGSSPVFMIFENNDGIYIAASQLKSDLRDKNPLEMQASTFGKAGITGLQFTYKNVFVQCLKR